MCCFSIVLLLLTAQASPAQEAAPGSGATQQSVQSLTFATATAPAQQVYHATQVELNLKSQVRNQSEVLSRQQTQVARNRTRRIEPITVEDGLTTTAYVEYLASESARDGATPEPDPIAGKTYLCRRVGEKIQVLTHNGKQPPQEEAELVAQNMETLGRPNPLAEFLAGKQLSVGDKLSLPADVAQRLLGLGSELGTVTKFELTLSEIAEGEHGPAGRFMAEIEAQRTDSSQMRLMIAGPMTIDAHSCRAIASQLAGPIGMSQSFNDPRGRLQLDSTGRVAVRVATGASEAAVR